MCGVFGAVLPGGRADRCRVDRRAGPVRAPASRPGIGRPRGERRRAADALQGPRHDQLGARRAAAAEPARPARHRPLPLLDDRLDDLGERPADLPARAGPGDRHRPQREPGQHPRPARPAARRPDPPAGVDRHGAPDRAHRRRARGGHGRGDAPGAAARPRRVQPGRPRRAPGHRRARPVRVPAARPRAAARPGRRRRRRRPVERRRRRGRLVPVVGDGRARHRRGRLRARRPARRDGHPRARPGAAFRALRRGDAGAVRLRAHLLRPARLVHGGAQPVRGPTQDGDAARGRASDRRRPRDARARHRRTGRGRLRRGVRAAVPRGDVPQPVRRADVHPAVGRRCATGASRSSSTRCARSSAASA